MNTRIFPPVTLLITLLCLSGCSTVPKQQAWISEPGVLDQGLTIEIGPSKEGTTVFRIFGASVEGATFSGVAHLSQNGWLLSLSEMHWFSNWSGGWTEAQFASTGELLLRPNGQMWDLSVATLPRLGDPVSAAIRYYDSYLTGERGVEEFARRWDRIRAVVALLKQKLPERSFECTSTTPQSPSFQAAVGKFLFPELFGYPIPPSPGYRTIRSESISWNVDFTEANFPENLREIRNSGTMLRDFEECLRLWRFAFCSDELWNHGIDKVSFSQSMQ